MAKLTEKQQRFVNEYLIDLNATQAAIRAGYKVDNARQTATENLAKPYISEAIEKALAERSRRTGINQDRVVQELAKIAFVKITDVVNDDYHNVVLRDTYPAALWEPVARLSQKAANPGRQARLAPPVNGW